MNMQVLGNHKAHFDLSPCLTYEEFTFTTLKYQTNL